MPKYLSDKNIHQLRRLLLGDGHTSDYIDQFLSGPPGPIEEAYARYYRDLTTAQRNRLFAAADRLKRKPSAAGAGVSAGVDRVVSKPVKSVQGERRGRGPGKVPAGESFTLVLPLDLLAQYRDLAFREQRSVAQLIRLAMLAYLDRG
jgi:hypothetical protein